VGFLQGRFTYYCMYVVSLILVVLYLITLGWFTPFHLRARIATLWPALMGSTWLRIGAGIKTNVQGKENLPKDRPYIAVCNHQSEWETLYLARLLCPASVVMKESLLKIPVYGWGQRLLRPIAIDRGSPRASIRSILTRGAERLREGSNVLIFPEGTRVEPGSVRKYTRTAFKLATETGTPIVPIVCNSGDFWVKGVFKKGIIQMVIGEPVSPEGMKAEELARNVEEWSKETYNAF